MKTIKNIASFCSLLFSFKGLWGGLFLFIGSVGMGQTNLVPNPSFENMLACPDAGFTDISSTANWYNPTGYSPDYFNSCATDTVYGQSVPKNGFGFQYAKSGVAYAGLISMIQTDGREYIQTALIDSLVAGTSYTVKFYVSVADSSPYAANNIGAYFSSNPVTSSTSWYLPFTPQISNDALMNPLDDRYGWTEVSGSFIAQGGEKYITIGNFNDDANTDTTYLKEPTWGSFSYHYIDDVSVTETFPNSVNEFSNTQITMYPNPSSGVIYLNSPTLIESITICSGIGQMILKQSPKLKSFKVDLSQFPEGIYYININKQNTIITSKITISR